MDKLPHIGSVGEIKKVYKMKLAIITGGSRGLGQSLLERYLNEGFQVHEFSRSGKSGFNIKCDFSSIEDSAQIIENTFSKLAKSKFSEIILINNVGTINPIGPISDFNVKNWINNININYSSSIITSGVFIKYFQNHSCNKTIANISSGAAIKGKYGWSLYCGAKAGIEQFSKSVAIEQNSQNEKIEIILIDPGIIDTDMQTTIRDTHESLFPELSRFIGFSRDGKLKKPSIVADKIYDILSNKTENGTRYLVGD